MENKFEEGSIGFDVQFFKKKQIETVELMDDASGACILVIPEYQGRVMTSSARGSKGKSFGWEGGNNEKDSIYQSYHKGDIGAFS